MQREHRLFLGVGLAGAIVAGALAVPAVAGKHGPGALDRSFANHGTLVVRDVRDQGNSVAVGRKGRVVIGGFENVMRLLPDGRPDRSFSGDGIWQAGDLGHGPNFVSYGSSSVAVQRKGGVVAAGSTCLSTCDFAVRRLTKRGQLDRSFGADGMARISFQKPDSEALSVARAREGKLIVGGLGCNSMTCDIELARLDGDGSLDPSFGRGGKVVTPLGHCPQSFGMALDSHNRIAVGGTCPSATVNLIRLKPDGEVNRSFGDHGRVRTHHAHIRLAALAVDSHDRIDVVGRGRPGARVLRYNPSGKLDRSFGNDGLATPKFPGISHSLPSSVAIDRRGRIVLAGDFNGFGFARLKPSGRVDRSFGRKGRVTIHDPRFPSANSVALDRRGRIVGVGYQRHGSPPHDYPAAVRLRP